MKLKTCDSPDLDATLAEMQQRPPPEHSMDSYIMTCQIALEHLASNENQPVFERVNAIICQYFLAETPLDFEELYSVDNKNMLYLIAKGMDFVKSDDNMRAVRNDNIRVYLRQWTGIHIPYERFAN